MIYDSYGVDPRPVLPPRRRLRLDNYARQAARRAWHAQLRAESRRAAGPPLVVLTGIWWGGA